MKHKCYRHPAIYGNPDPGWSHDESPCTCSCEPCLEFKRVDSLPDLSPEEIEQVSKWLQEATPGPWKDAQLQGFGAHNFIVTMSESKQTQWFQVVASLGNANFDTASFMAWCRDGVPRLIKRIKQLEKDNAYVESWRKSAEDKRGAWEHQVLVRADLERKIKELEKENARLKLLAEEDNIKTHR